MRISELNGGDERNAMHRLDAMCMRANGKRIHSFNVEKKHMKMATAGALVRENLIALSSAKRPSGIAPFSHLTQFPLAFAL